MSKERVDLSVLPIDVGFDVRRHGMVVSIARDTHSAAYDADGVERIVRGDLDTIVAALTAAGYKTEIADA